MATAELIPATDQDGTELWQHEKCAGVQPASRLDTVHDVPNDGSACPMCGTPGPWFPLFRPAAKWETAAKDRAHARLEQAATELRDALAPLRALDATLNEFLTTVVEEGKHL